MFIIIIVIDPESKPNLDKNLEKNFVSYCHTSAHDPKKEDYRPYFIFTSEERECVPGMSSLDLDVMTKEDAHDYIKNRLIDTINYENQDVEDLAKTLEYLPFDIWEAVKCIKQHHKNIQDYLTEYRKKKTELRKKKTYNKRSSSSDSECSNDFPLNKKPKLNE